MFCPKCNGIYNISKAPFQKMQKLSLTDEQIEQFINSILTQKYNKDFKEELNGNKSIGVSEASFDKYVATVFS